MKTTSHYKDASHSVMQDLVDCLLAEAFFGAQPLALYTTDEWHRQYGQPSPFGALESAARLWCWCSDEREQRHLVAALRPRYYPTLGKSAGHGGIRLAAGRRQ
ncbi:hypothetical protein [Dickeya chrysanthemi]|uniref:hypothetical protein n=1 Tax=Dickeya chrysanthemi TaxID=556 RepID=UPI001E3942F4|nr:hypothetical protein [Dickeya chrysanthemi]